MYAGAGVGPLLTVGLIRMIGARQRAGSLTLSTIRASPSACRFTDLVIAAAMWFMSPPHHSDASTCVTGPTVLSAALLVPVISRPLIATTITPLLNRWTLPNAIFHAAPPGTWPWIGGSVGAVKLPTRSLEKTWWTCGLNIGIWSPWPKAPTAEKADPANAAQASR